MRMPDLAAEHSLAEVIPVGLLTTTRYCWAGCAFCRLAILKPKWDLSRAPSGLGPDHLNAIDFQAVREVRLRGGLSLAEPFDYWIHVIRGLRKAYAGPITAFSPVEIWHYHQLEARPIRELVRLLRWAGADHLGPGGSETFDDTLREQWSPYRVTRVEWIQVANAAQEANLGISAAPIVLAGLTTGTWRDYLALLSDFALHHLEFKPLQSQGTRLSVMGDASLLEVSQAVDEVHGLVPDLPLYVRWHSQDVADASEILGAAGACALVVTQWEVSP